MTRTSSSLHSASTEAQLLLLTAAVRPNDIAIRQALSAGIDWEELCNLASHERATAVLIRHLGSAENETGTPGYQKLRSHATLSVMQMLQLEQLLMQTLDILAEQKMEAILLKGAGLAYTAYPSFADRPMGDVDLLVRPEQARRAWHKLVTRGWSFVPDRGDADQYAGHHHLPPLFQDSRRFRLEIHNDVLPGEHPFRFSTDAFWRRARQIKVNGRAVLVPDPMHQIWHASVHFAWSHAMQWGSWRTLRDAAAIVRLGAFEWSEFVSFAHETRAATCCFWTLRLSRLVAGAAVPDNVLASLRPPYPEFIIDRLERHFVSSLFPSEDRCPSVWLSRRLWEAGISPGWSGHGSARPWKVFKRWEAAAGRSKSNVSRGDGVAGWFQRIAAGVRYLRRLTSLSLPMNSLKAKTLT